MAGTRSPYGGNGVEHVQGKIELRAREAFGTVLVEDVGACKPFRLRANHPRPSDSKSDDALPVLPEYHPALKLGGRVVEMDDGAPRPPDRLESLLDQGFPCLGKHLDRDVVGYQPLFYEEPQECEFRLRGGREGCFDLLEAHAEKKPVYLSFSATVMGSIRA